MAVQLPVHPQQRSQLRLPMVAPAGTVRTAAPTQVARMQPSTGTPTTAAAAMAAITVPKQAASGSPVSRYVFDVSTGRTVLQVGQPAVRTPIGVPQRTTSTPVAPPSNPTSPMMFRGEGQLLQFGALDTDPETSWMNNIVVLLWPHICEFMSHTIRKTVYNLSAKMEEPVPQSFESELMVFEKKMAANPLGFPPTVSWINEVLTETWAFMRPILQQAITDIVVPKVRKNLPSALSGVTIAPCDIGVAAPQLTHMKTERRQRETTDGREDYIQLIIGFVWEGACDFSFNAPLGLSVGIKDFKISAELYIALLELTAQPPFIGGVSVWMTDPPEFDLDWTGALDVLDSEIIDSVLMKMVGDHIRKIICLPNRISFMMDPLADVLRVKAKPPAGLLSITIEDADGIRNDDFHFSTLWTGKRTSDPFVRVLLGAQEWQTSTISRASRHASWNESYHFLVNEPLDQSLHITIFDDDGLSGDDPLARLQEPISVLDLLNLAGFKDEDRSALFKSSKHRHTLKLKVVWAFKAGCASLDASPSNSPARVSRSSPSSPQEGSSATHGSSPSKQPKEEHHEEEHHEEGHHGFMDRLKDFGHTVNDKAKHAADEAKSGAKHVRDEAKHLIEDPKDELNHLVQEAKDEAQHLGHEITEKAHTMAKVAVVKGTRLVKEVAHKAQHLAFSIGEKIAYAEEKPVESHLTLSVQWQPFDLNEGVAKSLVPRTDRPTALLMVSVLGCRNLPHPAVEGADAGAKYWVKVRCLPAWVQPRGEKVGRLEEEERLSAQVKKTVPKPKQGDVQESSADTEAQMQDKILKLFRANVTIDLIAEVCGLSPQQVSLFVDRARSVLTYTSIDLDFEEGFPFLVGDPSKVKVVFEVYRTMPNAREEMLGMLTHNVAEVLGCKRLTQQVFGRPLVAAEGGQPSRMSISVQIQLRTIYSGATPLKCVDGASAELGMNLAADMPQKQRVVYKDKLGRERVQVDGVWEDDGDVGGKSSSSGGALAKRGAVGRLLGSAGAAASTALHKVGELLHKACVPKAEPLAVAAGAISGRTTAASSSSAPAGQPRLQAPLVSQVHVVRPRTSTGASAVSPDGMASGHGLAPGHHLGVPTLSASTATVVFPATSGNAASTTMGSQSGYATSLLHATSPGGAGLSPLSVLSPMPVVHVVHSPGGGHASATSPGSFRVPTVPHSRGPSSIASSAGAYARRIVQVPQASVVHNGQPLPIRQVQVRSPRVGGSREPLQLPAYTVGMDPRRLQTIQSVPLPVSRASSVASRG